MTERWAAILGYEGLYEISDWGNARSLDRMGGRGRRYEGRPLRPGRNKGHLLVTLCRDGITRSFEVHKLVMMAFVGPPPAGLEVCHNDGNGENNALTNLRYGTRRENMADRQLHGVMSQGSARWSARLTESDIPTIRARLAAGEVPSKICRDYGVTSTAIHLIKIGRTWKHVAPGEA